MELQGQLNSWQGVVIHQIHAIFTAADYFDLAIAVLFVAMGCYYVEHYVTVATYKDQMTTLTAPTATVTVQYAGQFSPPPWKNAEVEGVDLTISLVTTIQLLLLAGPC